MIAKFRWHFISICRLMGHGWKLADDNTIFLQQLIDIMCASDTELELESQNDVDTEQSTEVDNIMDVLYEDETEGEANF